MSTSGLPPGAAMLTTEIGLQDGRTLRVARDPIVVIGDLMHYQDLGRGCLRLVDEDGGTHYVMPTDVASVREHFRDENGWWSKPAA